MYPDKNKDYVISVGEQDIVLVKEMKNGDNKESEKTARSISDTLSSEFFAKVSIGVGTVVDNIKDLARSYKEAVGVVERMTEQSVDTINIVGGGCKDSYLNELTARYTGKRVLSGPVEATAIGNIAVQLMFSDSSLTLAKVREMIKNSFDIKEVNI